MVENMRGSLTEKGCMNDIEWIIMFKKLHENDLATSKRMD